jgi:hypothetical protein
MAELDVGDTDARIGHASPGRVLAWWGMDVQAIARERTLRRAAATPARLARAATKDATVSVEAWVGSKLLAAADEHALDVAVDELTESAELYTRLSLLRSVDLMVPLDRALGRWRRMQAVFGGEPRFLAGLVEYFQVAACTLPSLEALEAGAPADDPLWFAYDPAIPPAVGAALVSGVRSAVVLMAIEHAASSGGPVAPWLSALLVERWTAAQHAYLRLLASLPGNTVPDDIVPPEERLDLEALERETTAAGARLDALLEAGQRSGQAVYVPFPEALREGR